MSEWQESDSNPSSPWHVTDTFTTPTRSQVWSPIYEFNVTPTASTRPGRRASSIGQLQKIQRDNQRYRAREEREVQSVQHDMRRLTLSPADTNARRGDQYEDVSPVEPTNILEELGIAVDEDYERALERQRRMRERRRSEDLDLRTIKLPALTRAGLVPQLTPFTADELRESEALRQEHEALLRADTLLNTAAYRAGLASGRDDELEAEKAKFAEYQKLFVNLAVKRQQRAVAEVSPTAAAEREQLEPLSAAAEAHVSRILNGAPKSEIIVQGFNVDMSRELMQCLKPGKWLNDEVVNFFIELLRERQEADCWFTNTFFYAKLTTPPLGKREPYNYKNVQRWTKKVDVFSKRKVVIPVHLGVHWCLGVINFEKKRLEYYDSLLGENQLFFTALRRWLQDESMDKLKKPFSLDGWTDYRPEDIPRQENMSDCGMFMLKFADYLTLDLPLSFSQENMDYFRKRTTHQISSKALSERPRS